ncbi:hypothetical protein IV203_037033 [Nitzschia inconspicua]|uniref:Uncharacterized protein n=1 Tax=Nitzschia inconspicua TaxID=303405 RepID=A0A9K3LKL6_9STRA|nr:hypothetical protein IV203_037033 [Nitzschia inconspicua]
MNGPCKAGCSDKKIFNQNGLKQKLLEIGKKAIGDQGYNLLSWCHQHLQCSRLFRCKEVQIEGTQTNTCLLTYPSTDYVFANNREEIASAQDDCLTDALDDELWTIHQNKNSDVSNPVPKTKNLLLVFPENVVIEWEDVVNRSLVNDENEFPGLSLTVSATHPNASGRSVGHFVYWKIGRSDILMAKKGPVQQMRKNRIGFQF